MPLRRRPKARLQTHPVRVLFSFDNVGAATINPYTDMLFLAVRSAGAAPLPFSWQVALLGRYDVLHLQWPEMHLREPRWYLRPVQYALFLTMLARARISRIPIVQTQHNITPHEATRPGERLILRLTARLTTLWIRLVDDMKMPDGIRATATVRTIPHGTYVDRYRDLPRGAAVPGRLLFFGLIRDYKGVDRLLDAFARLTGTQLQLRICGEPDNGALAARIAAAAVADARVSARLEYLPDPELIAEIDAAEIIVLPYREMNNSGAAILALGRGRPLIVPDGPVTAMLAAEAGHGWVARYEGAFGAAALETAIAEVRNRREGRSATALARPDWEEIGALHVAAYREALAARTPVAS